MSNDDPFKSGSDGGAGITEYEGQLLLITPVEYVESISTTYGDADAVRVDFVVLDAPDGPEEVEDQLVFQRILIGAMKRQAAFNEKNGVDPQTGYPKMILGVLFQDEARKKPKQSPPWALKEPTDAQKAVARDYLEGRKAEPADPFASPAK
jgi:hypothetical protein